MDKYKDLDELREIVEQDEHKSVFHTHMLGLRDSVGAGKLGKYVRQKISDELKGRGLGHLPSDLPENQWDEVVIFKLGSKVAKVIDAVQKPNEHSAKVLRELVANTAKEKLDEIKAILED